MIDKNPGHFLGNVIVLNDEDVLDKLKYFIAAKPSDRMAPTGVPPHAHRLEIIRLPHEETHELSSNFSK